MNVAYLCLGGNIGDRKTSLELAAMRIGQEAGLLRKQSALYETEAWGVSAQQPYLNQCLEIETKLAPAELLHVLLSIELELGRMRDPWKTYEPRTIDIDILLYGNEVVEHEHLLIPHPRLHLRKFVLVPLSEIAGYHLHPVLNKTIFHLVTACQDASEVVLYEKA